MQSDLIVAIDAGSGAGRVEVIDLQGKRIVGAYQEWSYVHRREDAPGMCEFVPDEFFGILCRLIKECLLSANISGKRIAAVSCVSQRQGMVVLDRDGREIYAGPNRDMRAADVMDDFSGANGEITRITGLGPHPMYGLGRLKWFARHRPEVYRGADRVLMIADWIAYRLTGVKASGVSVAASSRMFDIRKLNYSHEVMALAGLRQDLFADVVDALTPMGTVRADVAETSGLAAGIPVFIAGGDTQAGALGAGAYTPGQASVVAGTTSPVLGLIGQPEYGSMDGELYYNCHIVPNVWCVEANGGNAGFALRWAREVFFPDLTPVEGYLKIEAEAKRVALYEPRVNAYLGHELTGESLGEGRGGFEFPVRWNIEDFTRAQLIRSVFSANAFAVWGNLERILLAMGCRPETLSVCGGQSKSRVFLKDLADLSGMLVRTPDADESTSLGAAVCAAVGLGAYTSIEQAINGMVRLAEKIEPEVGNTELCRRAYQNWRAAYTATDK